MAVEVTVPMDDKELFAAATAPDAPAEEPATEAPAEQAQPAEPEAPAERSRDERGRFVAKQGETPAEPQASPQAEAEPPVQPAKDDDSQVPSWRLRELREARDAEARRASEYEQELARTRYAAEQFRRELDALKNPPKVPDIFEDGKGFVDHNVRQALNPVQSEIGQMREFFSRKDAVREYGAEAVNAAYNAMGQALSAGDPDANAAYRQAMSSMDPYYGIMRWHMQRSVISEAGYDLQAYFDKELERRLGDQAFSSKLVERIKGVAPVANSQGRPNIDLPPSLNRAPGAGANQGSAADAGDMSDRSLFQYATAANRR